MNVRVLRVILAVLILNANWSGEERLPLHRGTPVVHFAPVALGASRVGELTWLGGIRLWSDDAAFGGFSAMTLDRGRFTLLSDGALLFSFTLAPGLRPGNPRFGELPGGPGNGWTKLQRDTESMVRDARTGRIWVGYERANMIWRYAPGFARAEASYAPATMRAWPSNGGAEAMVRLRDGRFIVFSEDRDVDGGKEAVIFAGDPAGGAPGQTFTFVPPPKYRPSDAVALPDGRLLILTRRFSFLDGFFTNKLVLVDAGQVMPGARVTGRVIATLAAPLIHDNFEAIAATREQGATILWLMSDDNGPTWLQRTLLLIFRLDA